MPMRWDKAHQRDLSARARADTHDRTPVGYDPAAPVTDTQMSRLRTLAADTDTMLPSRRGLTQEQANDLIGYLTDVKKGRRS